MSSLFYKKIFSLSCCSYDEDTVDSLDIKPPQHEKHRSKKSYRDKKHSKEHRHSKNRYDRDSSKYHEREYRERDYSGQREEKRHHSQREFDKSKRYYSHSGHTERREYYKDSISVKRERKYEEERISSYNKRDPERELEDLRTKLLRNRESQNLNSRHGLEHHERKEKDVIEVIDSPENYIENNHNKYKAEYVEKRRQSFDDTEQQTRKLKLLEAEREISRLKEESIKKREKLKKSDTEDSSSSSSSTSSDEEGIIKDDEYRRNKRLSKKLKKELKEMSGSGTDEEVDSASDGDSNSGSQTTTTSSSTDSENSGDEDVAVSPVSVGHLSKSERNRRSHSKSVSTSRSRSRSRLRDSRTASRSRSHSLSKSPLTRSHTRSRSLEDDSSKSEDEVTEVIEIKEPVDPKPVEKVVEEQPEPEIELPSYYPGIMGCRSVEEFLCLNRIEEGTYGVVYRAKDKKTNEIVALKRLKMEKEKEGFPVTSLREINTLLKCRHPNIVSVREIVVGSNMDKIFIVMEYVEHDLKSLMDTMKSRKQSFVPGEVKCLIQQLLKAVAHLHDNWILHRDLKTSNLLLSHKGILKVGDFGLAREYGSPLKPYTAVVVTRWYRAPEVLLCCKEYSTPIDMWSVGCIFAELLSMAPLFMGTSDIDQLNKIFRDLGTPNDTVWPGYSKIPVVQKMSFAQHPVSSLRRKFGHLTSEFGLSLLSGMLTYDPKQRLTAETALQSNYFKEQPLPIDPEMFPTWPAKSEGARKTVSSPKPPSGGAQYKQLRDNGPNDSQGFNLGKAIMESRQLAAGPGFSLKF